MQRRRIGAHRIHLPHRHLLQNLERLLALAATVEDFDVGIQQSERLPALDGLLPLGFDFGLRVFQLPGAQQDFGLGLEQINPYAKGGRQLMQRHVESG
jgi:hypothetical protein